MQASQIPNKVRASGRGQDRQGHRRSRHVKKGDLPVSIAFRLEELGGETSIVVLYPYEHVRHALPQLQDKFGRCLPDMMDLSHAVLRPEAVVRVKTLGRRATRTGSPSLCTCMQQWHAAPALPQPREAW